MKVYYDEQIDALYLNLGQETPDGVIEIAEGINIDTTTTGRVVGIEILNATDKLNIETILSYTLEFDSQILKRRSSVVAA